MGCEAPKRLEIQRLKPSIDFLGGRPIELVLGTYFNIILCEKRLRYPSDVFQRVGVIPSSSKPSVQFFVTFIAQICSDLTPVL